MKTSEVRIKNIARAFNYMRSELEGLGWLGLNDANTIDEGVFQEILNIMYGYKLKNTNELGPTCPGVDLGDIDNKIAYQVSSDNTKRKVQESIDKFVKYHQYKKFKILNILVLGRRQKEYLKLSIPQNITFDEKTQIIDLKSLVTKMRTLDLTTLQRLESYVVSELPGFDPKLNFDNQNDIQALEIYREWFERPALLDRWDCERDLTRFGIAIDELVSLLQSGLIRGSAIAKPRSKFKSPDLRKHLKVTFDMLRILGGLYAGHVRSGEINPQLNTFNFHDQATEVLFNTSKQNVINAINVPLNRVGLDQIDPVG